MVSELIGHAFPRTKPGKRKRARMQQVRGRESEREREREREPAERREGPETLVKI